MQKIIQIILAVTQLFPAIIAAVKAAEDALGAGQGAAKLDMVQNLLRTAYGAIQAVETDFETVWPSIQGVIADVVKGFNAIGTFKKAVAAA